MEELRTVEPVVQQPVLILQQYLCSPYACKKMSVKPEYVYDDKYLLQNGIVLNTVEDIANYNINLISRTSEGAKKTYVDADLLQNCSYFVCDKKGIVRRLPCPGGNGILIEKGDYVLERWDNGLWGDKYLFHFIFTREVENQEKLLKLMIEKYIVLKH